ncbi:MAG TPA: hypothetical protein VGF55_25195 [Gemmataceae bacterium]
MPRHCTRCRREFGPDDLARSETEGMEAERAAAGLEGIRFLYYACPACGKADIFVGILPLEGERPEDFTRRRAEMEAVVRRLHAERPAGAVDEAKPV